LNLQLSKFDLVNKKGEVFVWYLWNKFTGVYI